MYEVYCDEHLIYSQTLEELRILQPKLELEVNKTGSFTFTIYPSHPYFGELKKLKSTIKVLQDGEIIFRGRILNDEQGFYNEKRVACEGELAFLLDSIQRPYSYTTAVSPLELFSAFISNHNSQVEVDRQFVLGNVTVEGTITAADSTYLNTWDSINQKLITSLGGYLQVRHEATGNYIDYLADFDTLGSQKIEFGKNLLDLNKIIKGETVATAIIPLGAKVSEDSDERYTIAGLPDGVDGDIHKEGDYVYSGTAVTTYGKIFQTIAFDDVTDPLVLKANAVECLSQSVNLIVSIVLDAVDLSAVSQDISTFRLCTYIRVVSSPHELDAPFLVTKLSIDLENPKSNKLTLGTTYMALTEQTSGEQRDYDGFVKQVQSEVSKNTAEITQVEERTSSSIEQLPAEIMTQVSEDYYLKDDANTLIESVNTRFQQTNEEFEFRFNQFQVDADAVQSGNDAKFQDISKYIRFIDGNIVLGEDGNELTLKIQNDRISFIQSGLEVAYFSNRKLYVTDGEYTNSLQLGNYAFIPRANGNLSFKKVN